MSNNRSVHIIGAGPSGLVSAYELIKKNYNVNIYEKLDIVGGMCRTWKEKEYLLDTGPHIYHTPNKKLSDLWKKEFGDLLVEGDFWSKNVIDGDIEKLIDYPISWELIKSFSEPMRSTILEELENRNQNKSIGAKTFDEYVRNLVGPTLSKLFFTKYPEKIWGKPTSEITSEWAPKRIEIRDKITPFYYNEYAAVGRFGTGCVYKNLEEKIVNLGGNFHFNNPVIDLNHKGDYITDIILSSGEKVKIKNNDIIISTIPITILGEFLNIKSKLKFRGIASVYLSVDSKKINWPSGVNWLYFDHDKYYFNRITNSTSMCENVSPHDEKLITIESTFSEGDYIDKMNKQDFENEIIKQVCSSKIIKNKSDIVFKSSNKEKYVYPLQEPGYQLNLSKLKSKIESFINLFSIGTGGDFNYADSQVLFHKAFDLVDIINDRNISINKSTKTINKKNFKKSFKINEYKVGIVNCKPLIIGEIGLNHNGNFDLCKKLIDEAVKCGLKFVKLQTYKSGNTRVSDKVKSANYIEKITDQEESISLMFDKYNLSKKDQIDLFLYARQKGLSLFSTPFDIESAEFLNNELNVDCFKIASVDLVNIPLIRYVAKFKKPMILSCGMSNLSEIEDALNAVKSQNNYKVILLHCNSSYPAQHEDMNLSVINTLKNTFKIPVGLSDHTFGLLASTTALSIGASVIERHFTLDRYMEGPDHILSSEPNEMKELVNYSNIIPKMLGDGIKRIEDGEYFNINLQRKSIYALRNIKKGEIIDDFNTCIKGPGIGILPKYFDVIKGKKVNKLIKKDFPITWEDF